MIKVRKKNTAYLLSLKNEVQEAAEYAGIDFKEAVEILDCFFISLRKFLSDPRLPKIKIGDFGHFQTKYTTINALIKRTISLHKSKPSEGSYAIFLEAFIRMWKIRKRIFLARLKIGDGINWEKDINPDTYFIEEGTRILGKEKFYKYFRENGEKRIWRT